MTKVVYEPCVIIVAQGRKQAYIGGRVYTYDAHNYLIASVPMPVQSQVRIASATAPFLSMSVAIDMALLSEMILEMDEGPRPLGGLQSGLSASPLPPVFYEAAVRLVRAAADPTDRKILGPLYLREILYRSLAGPQGDFLRAIALRHGQQHRIARVLTLMHTSFHETLDVPALAEAADMSVSTFHHNFKAVTALSPLQYLKSIRLHKARSLMLYEALSAAEAAFRVGYGSASQFSREFRRMFGRPPTEEIARYQCLAESVDDEATPASVR
jgi:AraC-like DNA-binding protein